MKQGFAERKAPLSFDLAHRQEMKAWISQWRPEVLVGEPEWLREEIEEEMQRLGAQDEAAH